MRGQLRRSSSTTTKVSDAASTACLKFHASPFRGRMQTPLSRKSCSKGPSTMPVSLQLSRLALTDTLSRSLLAASLLADASHLRCTKPTPSLPLKDDLPLPAEGGTLGQSIITSGPVSVAGRFSRLKCGDTTTLSVPLSFLASIVQ